MRLLFPSDPSALVAVIVVSATLEELVHRGVAFTRLRVVLGSWTRAAVVGSLVFAAFHWAQGITGVSWAFFCGLGCCWLRWRTESLVPGIAAHITVNLGVSATLYVSLL